MYVDAEFTGSRAAGPAGALSRRQFDELAELARPRE